MKQLVINIQDNKYRFFMELMQSFDFVSIQEDSGDSKEDIVANLPQAFQDLKRHKQGKLKTTSAKVFLDAL